MEKVVDIVPLNLTHWDRCVTPQLTESYLKDNLVLYIVMMCLQQVGGIDLQGFHSKLLQ